MKIAVLLKAVRKSPLQTDAVLNGFAPSERAALATALALAQNKEVSVTALTAGPERDEVVLKEALKLGVPRAIRIWDQTFVHHSEPRNEAAMLAAGLRQIKFDLILTGHRSSDWASGTIGPAVAHFLRIPHVTAVVSVDRTRSHLLLTHRRERDLYTLLLKLPALVTITAGPLLPAVQDHAEPDIENINTSDLTLPFRVFPFRIGDYNIEQRTTTATILQNAHELVQLITQAGLTQ